MRRVVVEHDDPGRLGQADEGGEVRQRGVAPADARRVLLRRVLRVVEEDVGARGRSRSPGMPVSGVRRAGRRQARARGRAREAKRAAVLLEPVRSVGPGCVTRSVVTRSDPRSRVAASIFVEDEVLSSLSEKGRGTAAARDTRRSSRASCPRRAGPQTWRVDSGSKRGVKKPSPCDVIEVQVGEQEMHGLRPLGGERGAERPNSRAGVEDERRARQRAHLDARRVAPVRAVSAPGLASEPRQPQIRARTL